jgi:hypothetical protein
MEAVWANIGQEKRRKMKECRKGAINCALILLTANGSWAIAKGLFVMSGVSFELKANLQGTETEIFQKAFRLISL